jgi:hypothetical protein
MTTNTTAEDRLARLGVYIAATPELPEHPKIADAASELF